MKVLRVLLAVILTFACSIAACGASVVQREQASVPETIVVPQPAAGWEDSYLTFMQDNYDIFTALWPDGVGGVGFIDLDLDGTPEMVVFDQGASVTMGAQLFDLIDGKVYCVSSTLDSAAGAFDGAHLSQVHACASFFESFRLSKTANGWCFWVDSSNGTEQTAWDEVIRFDSANGVLTPASVCYRYLEFDPNSGLVATEKYIVNGAAADGTGYQTAAGVYQDGQDTGYDAKGVYLWDDFDRYSASYDGFIAMVKDALSAYAPITDTVTLVSMAG